MLSIARTKWGIRFQDVFFTEEPDRDLDGSCFTHFTQAAKPLDGFIPCGTRIVELSEDSGSLFNSLSSNTRYKIRRAEREGISCSTVLKPSLEDIETFIQYFDTFARLKKQPVCNRDKLQSLRTISSLILTNASDSENNTLVAHAYIADSSLGRMRLLYSASHFRSTQNTEERNRIGRANRFLHWQDMLVAREQQYRHYDLGGFPLDQSDPGKNAIARFKAEFGGKTVTEYNGFASRHRLVQHTLPKIRKIFV